MLIYGFVNGIKGKIFLGSKTKKADSVEEFRVYVYVGK